MLSHGARAGPEWRGPHAKSSDIRARFLQVIVWPPETTAGLCDCRLSLLGWPDTQPFTGGNGGYRLSQFFLIVTIDCVRRERTSKVDAVMTVSNRGNAVLKKRHEECKIDALEIACC